MFLLMLFSSSVDGFIGVPFLLKPSTDRQSNTNKTINRQKKQHQ
jgi:hypothetical protein